MAVVLCHADRKDLRLSHGQFVPYALVRAASRLYRRLPRDITKVERVETSLDTARKSACGTIKHKLIIWFESFAVVRNVVHAEEVSIR